MADRSAGTLDGADRTGTPDRSAERCSIAAMAPRRADGSNRVVITGMGAVSPAGKGVPILWEKLMAKECCLGSLSRFDATGFEVGVAGQIPDYDANEQGFTKKEARRLARFVQYAILAADEAMAQSGLGTANQGSTEAKEAPTPYPVDSTRIGCFFGSGIGGLEEFERGCNTLATQGPKRLNPLFIPTMISNMAAGALAIRYGLRGECIEVVTACASGAHNIGAAYRSIKHGYLDAALAGGTEESITPVCMAGFSNLGALSKSADPREASLPFDVRRNGFVAGEGAGAVVLESLDHALARGATILAEVAGFGSTGDAFHITAPEPSGEGLVRAMRQALDEAGCSPDDIGHVNAHGTATPLNDRTEAAALAALCGEAVKEVPVVSVKGAIGHTLGAAGALEAIICALSVAQGVVPATVGFQMPDPECPVRVLTAPLFGHRQKVALSNSLGFGGHNATLAIMPWACGEGEAS
ncbi:MAG: beta-ketoacyl-ACP synthase II [Coriobacteriaceae bacterium]|nr:beta-ketoacyl-ACP synthase II [Coriobacteriaceae bacterium]